MGRKCSVPMCKTGYKKKKKEKNNVNKADTRYEEHKNDQCYDEGETKVKLSVFLFPLDNPSLLEKWKNAIPSENLIPTEHNGVCELHFIPDDNVRDRETMLLQVVDRIYRKIYHHVVAVRPQVK